MPPAPRAPALRAITPRDLAVEPELLAAAMDARAAEHEHHAKAVANKQCIKAAGHPKALSAVIETLESLQRERRHARRSAFAALMFQHATFPIADNAGDLANMTAAVDGFTLRVAASELTRTAVRDYKPPNIARHTSLWFALRFDAAPPPKETQVLALQRAAKHRLDEVNRFTAGVRGVLFDAETAAMLEYQAAVMTYLAARDALLANDARERARAGRRKDVEHRRDRLALLVQGLNVGSGGWTMSDAAHLVIASERDWNVSPCPVFAKRWMPDPGGLADLFVKDRHRSAIRSSSRPDKAAARARP